MDITSILAQSYSASPYLLTSLQSQMQAQAQAKEQIVADQYNAQINQVQQTANKLNPVVTSIQNAISSLQNTVNSLGNIDTQLMNMGKAVFQAATDTNPQNLASYGVQFDAALSAINSMAQGNPSNTNLLGSLQRGGAYTPNQITYQTGADGQQTTVYGTYLGSDFQIKLADGSFFMPSGTQVMQNYTAYPLGKQGYPVSTASGTIQINGSYSDASLSFTTATNTSSPTTYTGNVTREGLGVLQSWMYNGLSTSADQTRANTDIAAARSQVAVVLGQMNAALSAAQGKLASVQQQQTSATSQVNNLQNQAQQAMQDIVNTTQQQYSVIANSWAAAGIGTTTSPFGAGDAAVLGEILAGATSTGSAVASGSSGAGTILSQAQSLMNTINSNNSAASNNPLSTGQAVNTVA